ncbi:hypothetical protein [Paenibacillus koleovorans]|uniref:hypothetical protein n=1 Tax=Paenibacillus koleovorans TaxID=121608 RepID=UPI000FDC9A91|nr:hypothetical protein [Paenibacillus koleovorans]
MRCSGRVVEANSSLDDTPEQVNQAPYAGGWMIVVELSDPSELDILLSAKRYIELYGD